MANYLGQNVIDVNDTPFKAYKPFDWAMYFIESYGSIDGAHHKQWVMDQVARIYNGTPVIIHVARWDDGNLEYRVTLDEPTEAYENWVRSMLGEYDEENDEYEYDYDPGIAP